MPSQEYRRIHADKGSFAQWLRALPLNEKGASVLDYRGKIFKNGNDSSVAWVVKWNIAGHPLEQCMDIVIRFYSEYLWQKNQTQNVCFPLPGGTWLHWNHWKKGFRPYFKGIHVEFRMSSMPDSSYFSFNKYLNVIFAESHTQQFYHAYQPIDRNQIMIGDFIVRKGTKGHTVMVVDLATNTQGELIALIGNGDTPACQFFLLNYKNNNPWVPLHLNTNVIPLPLRREMSWDGLRRFSIPIDE